MPGQPIDCAINVKVKVVGSAAALRRSHVPLHVQRKVVGARKRFIALLTVERFVARMFPIMARKLVRSGKLPAATLPRALVGFLAGVRTQVRLQMARLGVGFVTRIVIGAGV